MPTLPVINDDIPQALYDALIGIFTKMAQDRGQPGAAAAYRRFVLDTLVELVRRDAYLKADAAAEQVRTDRRAQADALLASILDG